MLKSLHIEGRSFSRLTQIVWSPTHESHTKVYLVIQSVEKHPPTLIKSIYTHKTKGKNITIKFIHDQKKFVAEKMVFGFRARARVFENFFGSETKLRSPLP